MQNTGKEINYVQSYITVVLTVCIIMWLKENERKKNER